MGLYGKSERCIQALFVLDIHGYRSGWCREKIPVIVSRADGGFYISETTTAARKKDGKTYVAIADHIANFSPYTSGKKYDKLEDAYNAYQKLLADGTYPN